MTTAEVAGYVAAGLVFATFYMRTMIPLRLVGIASNLAFLVYSWLAGLVPIFVLHAALLPLNMWRLMQIRTLVREVRKAAAGDLLVEGLLPFMSPRRAGIDAVLFRRGDTALEMFYILSGAVRLQELGTTLGPGAMLGEISLFAPGRQRTATAVCTTDVELLAITADQVMQLYYHNPRFAFHVIRLITGRLIENLRRVEPAAGREVNAGAGLLDRVPTMGETRPALALSGELKDQLRWRWMVRVAAGGAVAVVLATAGWQLASYLRSTISRESAVTSWIHVATAPIVGNLDSRLPAPGDRVGPDGRIVRIRNRHNDPSAAERSVTEVARAQAVFEGWQRYLDGLGQLDAEWRRRTAEHAAAFKQNLAT